jgi:K+-transporting ATPase ATPase C chain
MMSTLLLRQAGTALRALLLATVVLGLAYPLAVWAVSRLPGLHDRAEGSVLAGPDGTPAGSALVGVDPVAGGAVDPWFHTRPSASADDVLGPGDPSVSGGSNLGGFSPDLRDAVEERRARIAAREGVDPGLVPADAVTASASGVDPDISPAYAALQVARVARVTGLPQDRVGQLVADGTAGRALGFLGEPAVNVTRLNLALARAAGEPGAGQGAG